MPCGENTQNNLLISAIDHQMLACLINRDHLDLDPY